MERCVVGACLAHRDIKLPNTIHRFLLFSHHRAFSLHPITSPSSSIDSGPSPVAFPSVHHSSLVPSPCGKSPAAPPCRPPGKLSRRALSQPLGHTADTTPQWYLRLHQLPGGEGQEVHSRHAHQWQVLPPSLVPPRCNCRAALLHEN